MKYKAVIFDLFGTLVDVRSRSEYFDGLAQMASVLSVPSEEFMRLWLSTSKQRGTGIFSSIEANIEYICKELNVSAADNKVEEATSIRLNSAIHDMKVDKGGTEVVSHLKSKGYKVALISNCSPDVPILWEGLPFARLFEATVFSCLVGLQKPDPRIYRLAAEKLHVESESCLYIGDGDGDELAGAASAGMHPVLIRNPHEDPNDVLRAASISQEWNGPVIASLKEVLTLLK